VIHHDPSFDGTIIAHAKASDLPDFVPTLAEAMEVLRGTTVNVEIKNSRDPEEPTYDDTGSLVAQVLDCLHEADVISSVIVSCFDLRTCAQVRSYDIDVKVAWLVEDTDLSAALTQAHVLGFDAVNPYFSLVTPAARQLADELGLAINVWTVNAAADLRAMASLGVSSVITDEPALAIELLRGESS
jgi:glycerophosphoryl diester phosphodiesterase